jgi:hypothetical protein
MAEVVGIGELSSSLIKEALNKVSRNEITHGIFVYREIDGTVKYACFGEQYATYLIGCMARVSMHLHGKTEETS